MGPDCLRKQKALRCVSSTAAGTPAESPSFRQGGKHVKIIHPRRARTGLVLAAYQGNGSACRSAISSRVTNRSAY
jgi:hypothetical protein